MIQTQNATQDWNLNKGYKVWKLRKKQTKTKNNKKKQKKHTKQNKTKDKWERKSGGKIYPPNPTHFSEWFFTCSLAVSSSKSLEHNPFTSLKLYHLFDAIIS